MQTGNVGHRSFILALKAIPAQVRATQSKPLEPQIGEIYGGALHLYPYPVLYQRKFIKQSNIEALTAGSRIL